MEILKFCDDLFSKTLDEREIIYDKFVIDCIKEMTEYNCDVSYVIPRIETLIDISIEEEVYEATEFLTQVKRKLEDIYV